MYAISSISLPFGRREGATYTIRHSGESDQVVVNQAVFPNIYYVTDGSIYVGKYNFSGRGR